MLMDRLQKRIDELEKEKFSKSISEERLQEIDKDLKQYREMLERLGKE